MKTLQSDNYDEVRRKLLKSYDRAQKDLLMLIGSPKTVTEKIKTLMRVLRPGIFTVFSVQGQVSNEDRMTNIRLLGQEVSPAVKEYAKELGLADPFERRPGSNKLQPGTRRASVVDRTPLKDLGMLK